MTGDFPCPYCFKYNCASQFWHKNYCNPSLSGFDNSNYISILNSRDETISEMNSPVKLPDDYYLTPKKINGI